MPIYKTHMRLHIYYIQQTDYGTYKCVAKNPRGETDGTIRLYSEYYRLVVPFNLASSSCSGERRLTSLINLSLSPSQEVKPLRFRCMQSSGFEVLT